MHKEYEYSFVVNDLTKYFDYCKEHKFKFVDKFEQTRVIYRKPNKTMARITINKYDNYQKKFLDFKEDNLVEGEVLKELKESLPIEFTDDKAIESILEFLGYVKDNSMKKIRTIYEKKDAKFEFDEYILPKAAKVVAVEGNKDIVDKIYNEIKKIQ